MRPVVLWELRAGRTFLTYGGEAWARHWIREQVRLCELYEADEWLMFDGQRLFDPHIKDG